MLNAVISEMQDFLNKSMLEHIKRCNVAINV